MADNTSPWDAQLAEQNAFDAIRLRINQGVKETDPKVPVFKLVQAYGRAVERRVLISARDSIQEQIRP